MNYSQLREEIQRLTCNFYLAEAVMTAIDTYLEEKAREVEKMKMVYVKDESDSDWFYGYANNQVIVQTAAIIRSKE